MTAWPEVPLSKVLQQHVDYIQQPENRQYPKLSVKLYGKGVELDTPADGATLKMARHQLAKAGQVILSEIWGKKGAIGMVPPEGEGALCTSHFFLFDVDERKLDLRWLGYVFRANYLAAQLEARAFGTTGYAAVRPKDLLAATIPLPPLEEQQRIVAKIERLAAKIDEARGLREQTTAHSQRIIDNRVNEVFQAVSGSHRKLRDTTSKIGSGSTPLGGRAGYLPAGVPFVRSLNVRMRHFQWADMAHIDEATHQSMANSRVQPGDVLLNITGASIGRVACAPSDLDEANVNQHVAIVRPHLDLLPEYLMYFLSSPTIQAHINDTQKGATRQGFTKAQIEEIGVPVPSLDVQQSVVAHLHSLESQVAQLHELQSRTEAELNALLPSILDRAFRGEL